MVVSKIELENACPYYNSHLSLSLQCKLKLDTSSTTLSLNINRSYLKIYNMDSYRRLYVFMVYKSGALNLTLANDGPV